VLSGDAAEGPGSDATDGPVAIDGAIDVASDSRACWGTGIAQVCFATSQPTGTVTLSGALNTTTSSLCATDVVGAEAANWCVIAGTDVTVTSAGLAATGNKVLVLLATNALTIDGTLDVASHRGGNLGAGAGLGTCNAGTAPGAPGGGAGGSFGDLGGDGSGTGKGTTGAKPAAPTAVRSGCEGQPGNGPTPGARGRGGGAVMLVADAVLQGAGTINASGASGGGGTPGSGNASGGGGGGSGGMIVLAAPSITLSGLVFANGGSGGEGSGTGSGTGNPGTDPTGAAAATGGNGGSSSGGDGGDGGAAGATTGGPGGTATNGGGGGGGSVGIVRVLGTAASATFSPAPS
jgi:hypothetical protein